MNEPETFGWFMARHGILLFFFLFFHFIPFLDLNINANLHDERGTSTPDEESRQIEMWRGNRIDEEEEVAS